MTELEIKQNFANNLKSLRKEHGLTQIKLASALNYSDKSVSKWEKGDVLPDVFTLHSIAAYFDITIDQLIMPKLPKLALTKSWHTLIYLMATGLPVFVATLVFFLFLIFKVDRAWLIFIFSLPVCSIVSIVLTSIWFKPWSIALSVSALVWTLGVSIFVSFSAINHFWFIFIICFMLQSFVLLFYFAILKRAQRDKAI